MCAKRNKQGLAHQSLFFSALSQHVYKDSIMDNKRPELSRDSLLTAVVIVLLGGALAIAIVDPSTRPSFIDLAKVGMAGYLGWMVPRSPLS